MPIILDKLPEEPDYTGVKTLKEIVDLLPDKVPFYEDVWIMGSLASRQATYYSIWFYVKDVPSLELVDFLRDLLKDFKVYFTKYQRAKLPLLRVYNHGCLDIDRDSLTVSTLKDIDANAITLAKFKEKLPKSVPFECDIWLTGGLAKRGASFHDIDLLILEIEDYEKYNADARKYFRDLYSDCQVDLGSEVFGYREPVSLFKIYSKGTLTIS